MLTVLFTLFVSLNAFAQDDAISRYFKKHAESDKFTSVYISKKMFNLIAKIPVEDDEKEIRNLLSKLERVQILTSDKVDGIRMYKEAFSLLPKDVYEELMIVKEGNEEFRFLIKEANGKIMELLMLKGGKNEFLILSIVGEIDLNEISKVSKTLDVDGFNHLNKVKDKKK